jgi:colicin import membrane protein
MDASGRKLKKKSDKVALIERVGDDRAAGVDLGPELLSDDETAWAGSKSAQDTRDDILMARMAMMVKNMLADDKKVAAEKAAEDARMAALTEELVRKAKRAAAAAGTRAVEAKALAAAKAEAEAGAKADAEAEAKAEADAGYAASLATHLPERHLGAAGPAEARLRGGAQRLDGRVELNCRIRVWNHGIRVWDHGIRICI